MVYESDFYTTRRPYYSRPSPTITSYSVTRRQVNWDRHPDVPRPSQIQLPYLAFSRVPSSKPTETSASDELPRGPQRRLRPPLRTHRRVLFEVPAAPINWRY